MPVPLLQQLLLLPPSLSDLKIHGGDAECVGVRYVPKSSSQSKDRNRTNHPPLRIFYPGRLPKNESSSRRRRRCVGWFDDEPSVVTFLLGYLHLMGIKHDTLGFRLIRPFLYPLSWLLPMYWRRLPDTYKDVPFSHEEEGDDKEKAKKKKKKKFPLIVFSHGLTGTGQENMVLCSAWAKQGYIVVAVHHTDGSSVVVPQLFPSGNNNNNNKNSNTYLWYQHGPSYKNYDATFRPKQIEHRVQDLFQAIEYMTTSSSSEFDIDENKIIAAGFSYGAATAALAACSSSSQNKNKSSPTSPIKGLLLIDGWFYIDVSESANIEFEFPPQLKLTYFENGIPQNIPTILINSEQFANRIPKLYNATLKLGKHHPPPIVLSNTNHNNFCEIIFWFPSWILSKLGTIGTGSDPLQSYQLLIQKTNEFLKTNF